MRPRQRKQSFVEIVGKTLDNQSQTKTNLCSDSSWISVSNRHPNKTISGSAVKAKLQANKTVPPPAYSDESDDDIMEEDEPSDVTNGDDDVNHGNGGYRDVIELDGALLISGVKRGEIGKNIFRVAQSKVEKF